jgi:hypothetical protein
MTELKEKKKITLIVLEFCGNIKYENKKAEERDREKSDK